MSHHTYLAGSWFRKSEISKVRDLLEQRYFPHLKVTSSWLNDPDGPHDTEREMSRDAKRALAIRDLEDIERSDSIILFTRGSTPTPGGGRHFELSHAWNQKKLCMVVGEHEHIFMSLPRIHSFVNLADLLEYLDSVDLRVGFNIVGGR